MKDKIKVMIVGFGNIGRGIINTIRSNPDFHLSGILSRNPEKVKSEISNVEVFNFDDYDSLKNADLAILCLSSKSDLPEYGPLFAKHTNTIDCYDTHDETVNYFKIMDKTANDSKHVSLIAAGWNPGIFSMQKLLMSCQLPGAKTYSFFGLSEKGGINMEYTNILMSVKGVKNARQYIHAIPDAIEKAKSGGNPTLSPKDMHVRRCYIVPEENADQAKITKEIISMPVYFQPYKTYVNFVTEEELNEKFKGFPHDGLLLCSGYTDKSNKAFLEYKNVWASNPQGTANILTAYARAVYRFYHEGKTGAFTVLDIPPSYLSHHTRMDLIENFI